MKKKVKRTYTAEEKAAAVALVRELGGGTAARYSRRDIYGWLLKANKGLLPTNQPLKSLSLSLLF